MRGQSFNPRRSGWTGATFRRPDPRRHRPVSILAGPGGPAQRHLYENREAVITGFNPRRSGWTGATKGPGKRSEPSTICFNPRRSGWTGATPPMPLAVCSTRLFQSSPVRVDRNKPRRHTVANALRRFQSSPVRVDRRNIERRSVFDGHPLFQSSPVRVDRRNVVTASLKAPATCYNPRRSGWTGATLPPRRRSGWRRCFNPRRSGWTGAT